MSNKTYEMIKINVPWVIVPLGTDDLLKINMWIMRRTQGEGTDKVLADNCSRAINNAFDAQGLKYNTEAYGEVEVNNLRFSMCPNGIALPETSFIVVSADLERIDNPIKVVSN